jgi:hypothetical protein
MSDGIDFLEAVAAEVISGKETTERVIAYTTRLDVCFWNENGAICADGSGARTGGWWQPKFKDNQFHSGNLPQIFSVGVGAVVFDRITTSRNSGDKTVRYERVRQEDHHAEPKDGAERLNELHSSLDPEDCNCRFMPYTEAAADFFREAMVAMCRMAMSLDAFLSDDKKLADAITTRNFKLISYESPK